MGITYNPFSLEGKTILVTGASSGIGRSTAIECSKAGAKVVLTARNEARLKETLSMLIGEGHSYIVADLANEEQMDRLVAEMPIIDGLVNNAGFNVMQLVPFIKDEDLIKVMRVNLEAPILLTHKVVKKKKIVSCDYQRLTAAALLGIFTRFPFHRSHRCPRGGNAKRHLDYATANLPLIIGFCKTFSAQTTKYPLAEGIGNKMNRLLFSVFRGFLREDYPTRMMCV